MGRNGTKFNGAKLLNRREVVAFVRDELGKPFTYSTLTKVCAAGKGPPPAERWGYRFFYDPDAVRQWVEQRSRPA